MRGVELILLVGGDTIDSHLLDNLVGSQCLASRQNLLLGEPSRVCELRRTNKCSLMFSTTLEIDLELESLEGAWMNVTLAGNHASGARYGASWRGDPGAPDAGESPHHLARRALNKRPTVENSTDLRYQGPDQRRPGRGSAGVLPRGHGRTQGPLVTSEAYNEEGQPSGGGAASGMATVKVDPLPTAVLTVA
jgi:hypothetical protein